MQNNNLLLKFKNNDIKYFIISMISLFLILDAIYFKIVYKIGYFVGHILKSIIK